MKFKSDIEIQAGVEAGGSTGDSGQILSSTGLGVAWIDQSAVTSASNFVFFNVKNETGSTILKGKGVMAVGTDGNSGHILVDEMVANGTVEAKYFLGVLEENIPNGGFARVISFGQLDQFNTNGQNGETWNDGQILWCDPANPGDFTITEPDGPNVKIASAFILNSSTNGKIQVRVQANEGIHDLHDTKITSQVDGDVLVWDNTTGVWFNDSTLNVDYTNGRVGIGTTSPNKKLEVSAAADTTISIASSDTSINVGQNIGILEFASNNETSLSQAYTPFSKIKTISESAVSGTGSVNGAITFETASVNIFEERMRITSTGNVGIGTTPVTGRKLDVDGNTMVRGNLFIGDTLSAASEHKIKVGQNRSGNGYAYIDLIGDPSATSFYNLRLIRNNTGANATSQIIHTGTGNFSIDAPNSANIILNPGNANVGIGTTSPTGRLNIQSAASASYLVNLDYADGTDGGGFYESGSTDLSLFMKDSSSDTKVSIVTSGDSYFNGGNFGIGTTSPGALLDVSNRVHIDTYSSEASGNNAFSSGFLRIISGSKTGWGVDDQLGKVEFYGADTSGVGARTAASIVAVCESGDGASTTTFSSGLALYTSPYNAAQEERIRISANGNVGIGTTSPSHKLEVAGSVILDAASTRLKLKGGVSGTNSGVDWTFNTDSTVYAKIQLDYDTRASTGLLIDSGYPMTLDYSSGSFSVKKNGSSELTILNGNVGIGTTNPLAKLHVTGGEIRAYDGSNTYYANMTANSTWGYFNTNAARVFINKEVRVDTGLIGSYNEALQLRTSGVTRMYINNSTGNVGIGTTDPQGKLEVQGSAPFIYITDDTETESGIIFRDLQAGFGQAAAIKFSSSDNKLRFYNNDTTAQRMVIDVSGNVGIGTDSPGAKLQINNTSTVGSTSANLSGLNPILYLDAGQAAGRSIVLKTHTNGNDTVIGALRFAVSPNTSNYSHASIEAKQDTNGAADTLEFRTSNSNTQGAANNLAMIIQGGNVGIGTTSPGAKLEVNGDVKISLDNQLTITRSGISSSSSDSCIYVDNTYTGGGNPNNIDSDLSSYFGSRHVVFRYNGTIVGHIAASGTSGVSYNTSSSDERLKKNIEDWQENILDKFEQIEPKKFNFIAEAEGEDKTKGFMAQKMVDNFPEAYPNDYSEEKYYSFNPSGMVVYLMKAVKELVEKNKELENRIQTLENK